MFKFHLLPFTTDLILLKTISLRSIVLYVTVFLCSVASFILSCGVAGAVTEARKGRYALWPEWNEADVNAEKWEGVKPVKDKEKSAKSPSQVRSWNALSHFALHYFLKC